MNNSNKSERLMSLDALRGFDMLFIMGGSSLLASLAILFPTPFFEAIAEQADHVGWDGLRLEDMIFPLFLFIAGISFPFSFAKQRERGLTDLQITKKVVRRGLTLVLIGILYNGFLRHLDFENARYCSVLGRIGLAWMFAALIFKKTNLRSRIVIICTILVGYWLMIALIPAPDANGFGVFTKEGNIASYIDRCIIPGKLYKGIHDPEGLMGTIPAIATALLGMLTGSWIRFKSEKISENKKSLYLFLVGISLIVVGVIWNNFCPINKNLWSSSFVCTVGGISASLFAIFYYIIDVRKIRRWTFFFTVIGMNSITIYVGKKIVDFNHISDFFFGGIVKMMPENAQATVGSIAFIITCWVFLYILYRKKIFLKV